MENDWIRLLQPVTFRNRTPQQDFDGRDPFENDYARLIFSSPIRRLQDKTQVFPLEESDFIRTRLTHSLEVSSIARSIGKSIETELEKRGLYDLKLKGHMSSLLATAGLVHDLGNPPFGHFGEEAIQMFFQKYFKKKKRQLGWTEQEIKDFTNFDGNVQTFRILRKLHYFKDEFSYNLTFPTLASIVKYPRSSKDGNKKVKTADRDVADKKFGYFASEEQDFLEIDRTLGMNGKRHPIVYLLEAADDIAYSAADIEDGVKLGVLDFDTIKHVFTSHLDVSVESEKSLLKELDNLYEKCKTIPKNRLDLTVQQFRISTQREMIKGIIDEFLAKYDSIIKGDYKYEMLEECSAKRIRQAFRKLAIIVFNHKNILETELAGWKVIQGLLKEFIEAACTDDFNSNGNKKANRLYNLISSNYRYIYETYAPARDNKLYNKFQLVTDFISGMTDTYALSLYQKITGISL
ncbi:dNTP triphosphohydrolase [Mucilaginibacter sp. Bleaf8]|uniref:dGTP triphosphohydrolase n=1 Tax=Mucilaginibacter sp. Bleaf8 TaxID=2834430 RepID=UPI001BD13CC1|nr:dNTP triphosphohydrolase [Mucilaginibacter sp. Bleaf8]MBS7565394.1 dNTP triphosphohydrolase [Mucilaginibacter sp. Bleaf8]